MAPYFTKPLLNRPDLPFTINSSSAAVQAPASIGGLGASFFFSGGFANGMSRNIAQTFSVFSIAAWFYPRTLRATDNFLWRSVVSFTGWYLLDTNGTPKFSVFDGTTSATALGTTTDVTNQWQHMVGVSNSVSLRSVYRNGAGKGTDTTTISAVAASTNEDIAQNGGFDAIDGLIADIRIWNRALSDAEVWSLYDPQMRWDLYWQPNTRAYSFLQSAAAFDATQFPHIPMDQPYIVPVKMVPSGRVS
jgi:hypothetical protein